MTLRIALALFLFLVPQARAEEPVALEHSHPEIEALWRARIRSFLDRGVIPLIDVLSFLPRKNADDVIKEANDVMDEEGVAMIVLSGYWAKRGSKAKRNRWSYLIHEIVNAHPSRYVLATNKGGNRNWWNQKSGKPKHFIEQLEREVRGGDYPFIGEVEFRHYMSNAQCKRGKTHRDIDIPLDGRGGHRLFKLSAETSIPFSIHLEPEDAPLEALEEMLAAYPKARVILAHFGQIRHPKSETRFGPELIARLLSAYPNLYFDLSTGEPGRRYKCEDRPLDTVIWEDAAFGGQKDTLKPAYRDLFARFSDRFLVGLDFGPPNRQTPTYLEKRIANIRLILRGLPENVKHDIAYRNAWKLLTGREWE